MEWCCDVDVVESSSSVSQLKAFSTAFIVDGPLDGVLDRSKVI